MAHDSRVLHSFETPDGAQCVDLFQRPDGSFGFESYRRDAEDGRGWFTTGYFGRQSFVNERAALDDATARIPWLADIVAAGARR